MMTWDHVRFLALLIPTWLVLGAIALTLAIVPSKGAEPSSTGRVVHDSLAACADPAGVAAQQSKRELVAATQWHKVDSPDASEE